MYTYIFPLSPLFQFSKSTGVPPYRLYRQRTLSLASQMILTLKKIQIKFVFLLTYSYLCT